MQMLFFQDLENLTEISLNNPLLHSLNSIERIIITCDTTLTDVLESYAKEKIKIQKLSERLLGTSLPLPYLTESTELIFRESLLIGEQSGKILLYARSLINLNALSAENFKHDLFRTTIPLGHLLRQNKIETFRQLLGCKLEQNPALVQHFGTNDGTLISRSYVMYSQAQPIMLITEKFLRGVYDRHRRCS